MKKSLPLLALAALLAAPFSAVSAVVPNVENVVVYHNPAEFAGWPANEGMWSWGDEMLVAFEVAKYVEVEKDHSIDRDSPKRIVFARSLDGGKTWKAEEHPTIGVPEYLGEPDKHKQDRPGLKAPVASPGGIDFTNPDFALKVRGGVFNVSTDRGRTWSDPYIFPEFDFSSEARTSYIVTGKDSCKFFITGRISDEGVKYARSGVVETKDGGKTFQFLGWIGSEVGEQLSQRNEGANDPKKEEAGNENIFSIMPSAVRISGDHYIAAVRQRIGRKKWTGIFDSVDGGKTWSKLGDLEKGSSNPATLVKLEDGTIVAVYGNRRKRPLGVSGKISKDNGKTWSDEVNLREDARKWDIGYSRAVVRPDGTVVSVYYYTTEELPQNFIGASLWKPVVAETK